MCYIYMLYKYMCYINAIYVYWCYICVCVIYIYIMLCIYMYVRYIYMYICTYICDTYVIHVCICYIYVHGDQSWHCISFIDGQSYQQLDYIWMFPLALPLSRSMFHSHVWLQRSTPMVGTILRITMYSKSQTHISWAISHGFPQN